MIDRILNGLGDSSSSRSGSSSSTTSRSTTATADASYTVALPNGQIASNLTQAQYDSIKALLDIYNEAFALAKSNGLSVPNWGEYTTIQNAQNALAKLKAQIRMEDFAKARDESAQAMPTVQPAGVQPAEKKQGSGLLIPGLILAAGIVAAILLTKKSRR